MIAPHKYVFSGDDTLFPVGSRQLPPADMSQMPEAAIYCDGASSGNPGHSGIGVVIRIKKRPRISEFRNQAPGGLRISEYIGIATNNIAEYTAFVRGLEEAKHLGLKRVEIFLDSELLVKQIKGVYRIKSAKLKPFWEKARDILNQFGSYKITHIQRELNKEADLLAKDAIRNFQKLI